jgi:hypothetical protein
MDKRITNRHNGKEGVYCDMHYKNVSHETCISCGKCLPPYVIQSIIKKFKTNALEYPPTDRYVFRMSSICSGNPKTEGYGCKREAVLDYFFPPPNYPSLLDMMRMVTGDGYHDILLNQFSWNEIRLYYDDITPDGIPYRINGRLDGFDDVNHIIYDVKNTDYFPKFSYSKTGWLKHQRQVQGYYSLFEEGKNVDINALKLMYVGRTFNDVQKINNYFKICEVPKINILEDLKQWCCEVLEHIYLNLEHKENGGKKIISLPPKITGTKCTYCNHTERCKKLKSMGV